MVVNLLSHVHCLVFLKVDFEGAEESGRREVGGVAMCLCKYKNKNINVNCKYTN